MLVRILLLAWLGWCCISGPGVVDAAARQGAPLLQRAQDAVPNGRELEAVADAWRQRPARRRRHHQLHKEGGTTPGPGPGPGTGNESLDAPAKEVHSVLVEQEIRYRGVEIGGEQQQWVNVSNPTDRPVLVRLQVEADDKGRGCSCRSRQGGEGDAGEGEGDWRREEGSVFSLADGAVAEAVLPGGAKAALGPVSFRPLRPCLCTGMLSLRNNLSDVEWMPLQGAVGDLSDSLLGREAAGECAAGGEVPVERGKEEEGMGECSAEAVKKAVPLAAPASHHPDFRSAVIENNIQFATSAGVLHMPLMAHLPGHLLPLCLEAPPYSYYEKVMLFFFLLVTAMLVFIYFRVPVQLNSHSRLQASGSGLRSALHRRRLAAAIIFPQPGVQESRLQQQQQLGSQGRSSRLLAAFANRCVQAVTSAFAARFSSREEAEGKCGVRDGCSPSSSSSVSTNTGGRKSSEKKPGLAPILVKQQLLPQAKLSRQASRSGASPSSPGRSSFGGREEQASPGTQLVAAVKQCRDRDSPRKSPQAKTVLAAAKIQPLSPKSQVEAVLVQVQAATIGVADKIVKQQQQQQQQLDREKDKDKDKGRKKKKRSTVGLVKQEVASSLKSGSGSSSPPSSPASPASPGRPASPTRPVSPLSRGDHPLPAPVTVVLTAATVSGNANSLLARRQSALSGLEVDVTISATGPQPPPVTTAPQPSLDHTSYRRSDTLSVDSACSALKEMARSKAVDSGPSCGTRMSSTQATGLPSAWSGTSAVGAGGAWAMQGDELEGAGRGGLWSSGGIWGPQGLRQRPGPVLTTSATFPRRGRAGGWDVSSYADGSHVDSMDSTWPSPVIDSAASRAPGLPVWIDRRGSDAGLWSRHAFFDQKVDGAGSFLDFGGELESAQLPPFYDMWDTQFAGVTSEAGPGSSGMVVRDDTRSLFSNSDFVDHGMPGVENSYPFADHGMAVPVLENTYPRPPPGFSQTPGMSALPATIRTRTDSRFGCGSSLPSSPSGYPGMSPFDSPRAGMSPRQHTTFFTETLPKSNATRLGVIGQGLNGAGMSEGPSTPVRNYTPCMEMACYSPMVSSGHLDQSMPSYTSAAIMDSSSSFWSGAFPAQS